MALPDGLSLGPELGFWVKCRPNSDQCWRKLVIMFIFLYEQLYLSIFIRFQIFGLSVEILEKKY